MAIIIKDFKMPRTCYDCPFCDYEFGRCFADIQERYTEGYGSIIPETSCLYGKINQKSTIQRYGHGPGKPDWRPLIETEKER